MKRLLLWAVVLVAAWYGWKHQDELRKRGTDEFVAVNHSGQALERLRVSVAGEQFAVESLEKGATKRLALHSERDGMFELVWNVKGIEVEKRWSGGSFNPGPILMRHRFEFTDGDGVVWTSERLAARTSRAP